MTGRQPLRCALTWCDTPFPARPFACGSRCQAHSPAALAGEIEPDAIHRRYQQIQTELRQAA